ncbi:MAG: hypothetical protein K0M45_01150 [Candidatus Paracaedibacteraceae bacterium]|nr:hypothetical protein [Candidatus Paracaedibacteraceae bacterium]
MTNGKTYLSFIPSSISQLIHSTSLKDKVSQFDATCGLAIDILKQEGRDKKRDLVSKLLKGEISIAENFNELKQMVLFTENLNQEILSLIESTVGMRNKLFLEKIWN